MRLNSNHEKDGQKAWEDSGLKYGQTVIYKGEKYTTVAIGYGMLLDGRVQIDNGDELFTVSVTDLEVVK